MPIRWGACGHPARWEGQWVCRVCWLSALQSWQVRCDGYDLKIWPVGSFFYGESLYAQRLDIDSDSRIRFQRLRLASTGGMKPAERPPARWLPRHSPTGIHHMRLFMMKSTFRRGGSMCDTPFSCENRERKCPRCNRYANNRFIAALFGTVES